MDALTTLKILVKSGYTRIIVPNGGDVWELRNAVAHISEPMLPEMENTLKKELFLLPKAGGYLISELIKKLGDDGKIKGGSL